MEFIPGMWEEEIKVEDFIKINKSNYHSGDFLTRTHTLEFENGYDVLKDEKQKFIFLPPFEGKEDDLDKKNKGIYIKEEIYTHYIETGDRKKMKQTSLLVRTDESERTSFFQPDVGVVPLYGTRATVNNLKKYIKDMDKQFQSVEWIQRRISHFRALEALERFETFAREHNINVKKPAKNAIEAAKMLWITVFYATIEDNDVPFSLYSIFELLDIFIENDLKQKIIQEKDAQRLVDELYVKMASLERLSQINIPFGFNLTIGSGSITKTTYRFVESAKKFRGMQIPFQLIFHSEEFPSDLAKEFDELFRKGHRFALSQSFRRKDDTTLTVTSSHTFFRNYEDVTIQLASLDLKKAFIIAINGGKEVVTNTNFYQVSQKISPKELNYKNAMEKFEAFLKYFITLYSEYMNVYTYYYDQFHKLPFRQSLTTEYPHYLINMAYHNVTPLIKVLTSLWTGEYELKINNQNYIEDIIVTGNKEEEFIASHLNRIINEETKKILFYKNGNYNIVFFSEMPFFQTQDKYKLEKIRPKSFERTSFSGYQSIKSEDFLEFIQHFTRTTYTHIRLNKI